MLPQEIFLILTLQSPLSWVSESFRQDIGQFHSPRMKPCKSADYFIKVNFHVVVDMEQLKASPVNLVCDMVLRKYVFSRLKADTFLSHSHVVTAKMTNILRHSAMLGYSAWSISFRVANAVVGTVLGSCRSHFLCYKVISALRLKR